MSDIKGDTWLSVLFEKLSCVVYTMALNKFKERLSDTEIGSEERFNAALDITKNLGFFDRTLTRFASLLTNVSFFFMRDIDEQEYIATLVLDEQVKVENEAEETRDDGVR